MPRRRKILVLTTTLPATPGDGTPAFVVDLSGALAREFDIAIIAPRVPGSRTRERVNGLLIERFPYFIRRWESLADGAILPNLRAAPGKVLQVPFLMISYLAHALRATRRWKPDLLHAHWVLPGGLVALLVKRTLGIPYVVSVHGADVFALRGPIFRILKRAVLNNAAAVGFASHEAARVLSVSASVMGKVIPMGVNIESLEQRVGKRSPERGRFLFVGRLVEKKGVDLLLRALAEIPEARLIVGGDGPDAQPLLKLARRLRVDNRVQFAGRLSRDRLIEELRYAHALVIPSRIARDGDRDTTPLVMSEGMSVGVPIIASELGGLAEQIEQGVTGCLVEPESPLALASALRQALEDGPTLEEQGRRAQERMKGGSLDLATTAALYEDLLRMGLADSDRRQV